MVKIKDIDGVMIPETLNSNKNKVMPKFNRGFNEAIDQQGSVEIGLNRDRLAKLLHQLAWPSSTWENQIELVKERYYKRADAIISAESTLLERKGQ